MDSVKEDSVMTEIRSDLEARMANLSSRLQAIQADRRQAGGPLPADWQEQATALENDEVLTHLGESTRLEIESISQALHRMDEGSYGTCQLCGDPIGAGRLRALPFASICIKCASAAEI